MDRNQLNENNSINSLMSIAAVLPGVMMSLMTLGILIADLLFHKMDSLQYVVYPAAYRVVSITAVACGIVCFVKGRKSNAVKMNTAVMMLSLFAVWMIVSTLVNGISLESISGVPYRYLGTADYLICLFAFMGCSCLITSERLRHLVLASYVFIADLVAITALYDSYNGVIYAYGSKIGLSAVFYHENHYGYFLVMAVLISAGYIIYGAGIQVFAGALSAVLNFAALGLNQTLGCILAVYCVIIIMLIVVCISDRARVRSILILMLFLAAAAAAAVIASQAVRDDLKQLFFDIWSLSWGGNSGLAGHGRWKLWTETIGYIRERPLLGYGCEGINEMLKDATGVSSPHNEVLTYAVFYGIPAAFFYLCGIVMTMIISIRRSCDSYACRIAFMAASGYFISSLFGVAMFYTLPFFFIFAGICSGNEENQKYI